MRHIGLFVLTLPLLVLAPELGAQDTQAGLDAYHRAVSRYFDVGLEEVRILSGWEISAAEIPVVLLLSREAGISPDAAASERSRGSSWQGLMRRYGVQVSTLHMSVPQGVSLGELQEAHDRLESTPRTAWSGLEFSDAELTGLVNLRVLSSALRVPVARVLQARASSGSWMGVPLALAGSA